MVHYPETHLKMKCYGVGLLLLIISHFTRSYSKF